MIRARPREGLYRWFISVGIQGLRGDLSECHVVARAVILAWHPCAKCHPRHDLMRGTFHISECSTHHDKSCSTLTILGQQHPLSSPCQRLSRPGHGTPLTRCNDCSALGGARTCLNVAAMRTAIGAGVAETRLYTSPNCPQGSKNDEHTSSNAYISNGKKR